MKTNMINNGVIDRTYCHTSSGEEVRVLWVNRYDQDGNESASYVYRLRNDDPRPKGRFCQNNGDLNDFLGGLTVCCWMKIWWHDRYMWGALRIGNKMAGRCANIPRPMKESGTNAK